MVVDSAGRGKILLTSGWHRLQCIGIALAQWSLRTQSAAQAAQHHGWTILAVGGLLDTPGYIRSD